jgi:hypothetical protein
MTLTTCLLALAALGAGEATESGETQVMVRIKSLEMKGVEWRGAVGAKLQPCARQGTATIWTADRATGAAITKAAAKVAEAPRVTTLPGSPASVVDEVNRNYVADIVRRPGESLPFEPNIQTVHDGWRGTLTCRPLDQGVLATVQIDANQFMAFHGVDTTDTFRVEGSPVDHSFKAQYQLPEVASAHVAGDWLIPKDGCLVIAFGVHTVAKADAKPAPVERVLLIQAEPFSAEPAPVAAARPQLTALPDIPFPIGPPIFEARNAAVTGVLDCAANPVTHIQPAPKAAATKAGKDDLIAIAVSLSSPTNLPVVHPAIPKLPSRAMPQPYSADGTKIELPALPDNALEPVSGSDESGVPRPSPQSIHTVRGEVWKSLTGVTLSGLTRKNAAALLTLFAGQPDDELSPIDENVTPTSATVPAPPVQTSVSRIPLGGGFVLEVPLKYISHDSDECDE